MHVAGPRPTLTQLARELADVAVDIPLAATGTAGETLAPALGVTMRGWPVTMMDSATTTTASLLAHCGAPTAERAVPCSHAVTCIRSRSATGRRLYVRSRPATIVELGQSPRSM